MKIKAAKVAFSVNRSMQRVPFCVRFKIGFCVIFIIFRKCKEFELLTFFIDIIGKYVRNG